MKRGFGIGLMLLASALLLVTIGVTLNVEDGMNFLLAVELLLIILISIGVIGFLFADKKWNFAHIIVLIIAGLGLYFGIKGFFGGTSSLELLALISLDLLGFVLAIFMVTEKPKVAREQKTLETFDVPPSVVYEVRQQSKQKKAKKTKKTKKKAKKKKAKKAKKTKKTAKKSANLEL